MARPLFVRAAIALTALQAIVANAALFDPKGAVVQPASESAFKKEVLAIEKPTLVAFTAPWCGHCKNLAPEFERAASAAEGLAKFVNVDCENDKLKPLCGQYGVQGFPTLKMFPPTKKRLPKDYQGERKAKPLVDYALGQLPLLTKKLKAEELQTYIKVSPQKPKVILFSTKPSSSALYKALALDFRRSMSFAFLKATEAPVRAAARIHLGQHIRSDEDLPVLVVVPAHSGDELQEIEKGSIERYTGKLKYAPLKAWLDEIKTRVGAVDADDATLAKEKEAARKREARLREANPPKGHMPPNAPIPEGGAFEWKAQDSQQEAKVKAKAKAKASEKGEKGKMISKERMAELNEEVQEQLREVKKKAKDTAGDVKKVASEGSSSASSAGEAVASSVASAGEGVASSASSAGQAVAASASSTVKSAASAVKSASDSGASVGADSGSSVKAAAERASSAAQSAASSASAEGGAAAARAVSAASEKASAVADAVKEGASVVAGSAKEAVEAASEKLQAGAQAAQEQVGDLLDWASKKTAEKKEQADAVKEEVVQRVDEGVESAKDAAKEAMPDLSGNKQQGALMKQFAQWMASENLDLSSDEQQAAVAEARAAAEKLARDDPEQAKRFAKDSEKWLLESLRVDRAKMEGSMTDKQRKNLDDMIDILEKRFEGRKDTEGIFEEHEREQEEREKAAQKAKTSHDEL